jgi:phosphoglycolate phosphatase-like HAD superfamily hydrolase
MDPFPEAAAALERLADGGLELAVLTNSSTEGAESSLEAAGLRGHLSAVVGSETVLAFQPHPASTAAASSWWALGSRRPAWSPPTAGT